MSWQVWTWTHTEGWVPHGIFEIKERARDLAGFYRIQRMCYATVRTYAWVPVRPPQIMERFVYS